MKDKASPLFSQYIIDGVQMDETPFSALYDCLDGNGTVDTPDGPFEDIIDEYLDKKPASFHYNADDFESYVDKILRTSYSRKSVDLDYPVFWTRAAINALLLDNLPLLAEFGFSCEEFGGGTVLVREVPADIRAEDTAATLEELAHKLVLGRADPEAARDELLHTMACKSAIKAGMVSDRSELAALVEKVQSGEIQYCPHGRPVKYKLSKYEIENMFKRA